MPADDDLIEAAPCPNCRSPLTVAVSDLGHLVECPGCGTQFRARRPGADASSPPPPPHREERQGEDRDDRGRDAEDRPRSSPRRTTGRDRYFGSEPERDRDYEDDRYRDARYRKGTPGSVIALAVMHFVYAGLLLLCGVLGTIGLLFGAEILQGMGGPEPNWALETAVVIGYVATAVTALFAGILALQRRGYGVSVAALGLACVTFVLGIVNGISNMQAQRVGAPGEEAGMVCGFAILAIFWMGYIVTNGILLAKSGRHFR